MVVVVGAGLWSSFDLACSLSCCSCMTCYYFCGLQYALVAFLQSAVLCKICINEFMAILLVVSVEFVEKGKVQFGLSALTCIFWLHYFCLSFIISSIRVCSLLSAL